MRKRCWTLTEHLGYGTHDPIGRGSGNSRNDSRAIRSSPIFGRWTSRMPRDTNSAFFEPQIVNKHQRRLSGIDEMLLALPAKGLTTREVAVDFADVYEYLGARRARRCRQTRRRTQNPP
ncbi:MAG: transposase [Mycobacterium sp.]